MKVRAKKLGYYQEKRRRAGSIFTLVPITGLKWDKKQNKNVPHEFPPEEQFSESWMERVPERTPDRDLSPQKTFSRATVPDAVTTVPTVQPEDDTATAPESVI